MSDADPAPSTCRVALCDDVETFRTVLSIVLGGTAGIDVVGQAANGREAVDLVAGCDVDVLLLDLAMPVMDGLEALPLIRRAAPDTRVIMLTGFGDAGIRERAMAAGAHRYLEKGLPIEDLVEAVLSTCSQAADVAPSS